MSHAKTLSGLAFLIAITARHECELFAQFPRPAAATSSVWLEGEALERQLDLTAGVTWSGRKLRVALQRLAASQRVAIFLDRRVDPDQTLDLSISGVPLRECLQRIARHAGLGVTRIGSVIYFGPADATDLIGTVAEINNQPSKDLPASLRHRLQERAAWRWEVLTTPRELLDQLSADAGLRISNLASIPHDLWPAADLPPLSLAERFTLVLAGFGRNITWDQQVGAGTLVPLPEHATLHRSYRLPTQRTGLLDRLAREFPAAKFSESRGTLAVEASAADHRSIQRLLAKPTATRPTSEGEKRYTLKIVNQPVGPLMKALAVKLGMEAHFDPAPAESLQRRVSFEVTDATLDELLRAALSPAGFAFRIEGQRLHIAAPSK